MALEVAHVRRREAHVDPAPVPAAVESYVLNTNSMKIHHPDCSSVAKMSAKNRQDVEASLDALLAQGYTTYGNCF